MPELEFSVYCDRCGAGLCSNTEVQGCEVFIDPCEECLETAREEAYEEGKADGLEEANE